MCGLAGIVSRDGGRASEALLLSMAGELRHRGPDGTGLLLDGGVGIVSTRLAIVDPVHGDQPLPTEDGRFWALQNGELYNYVELRDELRRRGHSFETTSDTEVLAHGYEEWGPGLLDRVNGDFAVAVWDAQARELFLARDRFGVRPLFLAETAGALSFASEIKALLRRSDLPRSLDPRGLADALAVWGIAPRRSAFAGVRELAPGHWLKVREDGTAEERRWWEPTLHGADVGATALDTAADELLEVLDDAVRLRLRADVVVATYLSGGLDSSVVAALAARSRDDEVQAFGLAFPGTEFDEGEHQRAVAEAVGVRLHQVELDGSAVADGFRLAVEHAEQPLLRTAPAPMLALSAEVRRQGHKVVLTGEGADELLGGYDVFKEAKVRRFWARDPGSDWRPALLQRVHRSLGGETAATGAVGRRFFARGLTETDDPLYSHLPRLANGERLCRVLDPDALDGWTVADARRELVERLPSSFHDGTPLQRAQAIETLTFLEGMLLHAQGDRMLAGNGVEGRYPYLDHRVAELAARLPDEAKLCGLSEKVVLRRVARRVLPDAAGGRAKQAYRAPIGTALAGAGAPAWVGELLVHERVAATGVLDAAVVERLADHASRDGRRGLGEVDAMALTAVLSVVILHERLVASPTLAPPLEPDRRIDLSASQVAA
jgi:asparagine synthase (glutamine-hydrolysing)